MRFHIDIDQVTDGRPEGRLSTGSADAGESFAGWVELLRLMEQRCVDETTETTETEGSSVRCS